MEVAYMLTLTRFSILFEPPVRLMVIAPVSAAIATRLCATRGSSDATDYPGFVLGSASIFPPRPRSRIRGLCLSPKDHTNVMRRAVIH